MLGTGWFCLTRIQFLEVGSLEAVVLPLSDLYNNILTISYDKKLSVSSHYLFHLSLCHFLSKGPWKRIKRKRYFKPLGSSTPSSCQLYQPGPSVDQNKLLLYTCGPMFLFCLFLLVCVRTVREDQTASRHPTDLEFSHHI